MVVAQKFLGTYRLAPIAFALLVAAPQSTFAADAAPSDEAVSEARRNDAKAKYQAGVEAYEKHRYKQAVDLFLDADKLAPSAPLSFNIGRAYERLGDDTSALRWYRDYLRRSASAPNAAEVRELVAKLASALSKRGVQQVTVLSLPTGATVTIDDQAVGVTPWTGELAPGKHHLLVTSRGHADMERDFELQPTEPLDVSLRLEAATQLSPSSASPGVVPSGGATSPGTQPASPASAPPGTAPAAAPKENSPRFGPWPWISAGVGAAALGGALAFELMRRSAEDDAQHESVQVDFQSAVDRMESRKTTARILLGVGGVALATGAVLFVVDNTRRSPSTRVGFSCAPGGCALSAEGRF